MPFLALVLAMMPAPDAHRIHVDRVIVEVIANGYLSIVGMDIEEDGQYRIVYDAWYDARLVSTTMDGVGYLTIVHFDRDKPLHLRSRVAQWWYVPSSTVRQHTEYSRHMLSRQVDWCH